MYSAPNERLRASASAWLQDGYVLGVLSGFSVLVLAWSYPIWSAAADVPCIFHELTGIPCPTCYGTRAMLAATSGRWVTALRFNPAVGLVGIGLFVYLPWAAGTVIGGWPRPSLLPGTTIKLVRVGGALVLLNWAYLIVVHA
ncbi:MAG: DUF2752 domain-containing protein [Acidobacteria bacterium]|nr:DUF2752 domain-containing protein [Acidobacteriota bacterium]